jgi:hypothetical protein
VASSGVFDLKLNSPMAWIGGAERRL